MNILLVQAAWPSPTKKKDPTKYFPFALVKIGSYYRSLGHNVALITDEGTAPQQSSGSTDLFLMDRVPFRPDKILFSTVFSYWFEHYLIPCVERYHAAYPEAEIVIGGIHASISPDLYRERLPYASIHVGPFREAESVALDFSLLPQKPKTQITRFSSGCIRKCSFCTGHLEPYQTFSWDDIAPKLCLNRLILNDNNIISHPDIETILKNLSTHKVNGKPISSVEVQGGFDVRILAHKLHLIELFREARIVNVRIAWDGGMEMKPLVETCLEALDKAGYHPRQVRCFVLYNFDLPFDAIIEKLSVLSSWNCGPIHSRFRPISLLHDGYVKQKKKQSPLEYYIHPGWTDRQIRAVGSVASDISRQARAGISNLDKVRQYYGRPSLAATIASAA